MTWTQLAMILNDNPLVVAALASAIATWLITNVWTRYRVLWGETEVGAGTAEKKLAALLASILTATASVAATGDGWDKIIPTALAIWVLSTFAHGVAKSGSGGEKA